MPLDLLGVRVCLLERHPYSPISDQPDILSGEIYGVIPICGMKKSALINIKPWNFWPFPVIQKSCCVDENIAVLTELFALFKVPNFDIISCGIVVPVRTNNLVLSFDILFEMILICK
jgi:hypothetical protein